MSLATALASVRRKASQLLRKDDRRDISATIPRNPPPPLDSIPRNILAFRTITQLLSYIQQDQAFRITEPPLEALKDQRLELKLTSAFSTVAVIEHEVVAVVTKRLPTSLQVVACVQPSDVEPLPITPSEPPSNYRDEIWKLLFTQNPRPKSKTVLAMTPTDSEPIITDARILAELELDDELKLDDDEAIKRYAEACW